MGHEDLKNQPFYQSLIQLNNDNGIVTFEDIVSAIKSFKAPVSDLDEVINALQEDGVTYSEDNDDNFEIPSPEDMAEGAFSEIPMTFFLSATTRMRRKRKVPMK